MNTPTQDGVSPRSEILAALEKVTRARRAAEDADAGYGEISSYLEQASDLRVRYIDTLPQVAIGRDPIDGAAVTAAVDTEGLDGPFWDSENPARPVETMPESFVVLTGALRLVPDRLEFTPYLCLPGPEVPFVVPDLLARDGVKAVVATVPIGIHTGYAISYFSPRPRESPPLPNEWGRREYWLRDQGTPVHMASSYDELPAPDFDLEPWIGEEKLAWVAPGDDSMQLMWGTAGCPYLRLPGNHRHQRVQVGQLF